MTEINWQNAIDNYLEAKRLLEARKPVAENEFHPSSLNGCVRQCTLNRLGLKELDKKTLRHFAVGTMLHRFIQREVALGYIGKPVEFEKAVEVEIDGVKFVGHVDCFDGETVYDFKSTANVETSAKYDSLGYNWQLTIYAAALNAKKCKLVYIDKRDLTVVEKDVDPKLIGTKDIVEFCRAVIEACKKYNKTRELPPSDDCWQCKKEEKIC